LAGDLGQCAGAESLAVTDPTKVIAICTSVAERGEAGAAVRIGVAYEFGSLPTRSPALAYRWYRITDGLIAYREEQTGDVTGTLSFSLEIKEVRQHFAEAPAAGFVLRGRITDMSFDRIASPTERIDGIQSARNWLRDRNFLVAEAIRYFDDDLGEILGDAVIYGDVETLSAALNQGIDPNLRSGAGYTPLILAAKRNRLNIVKLLLAHAADFTLRDRSGQTALNTAVVLRYDDIAAALRAAGAKE
jgi:hypothetical protein